jgi:hypothetical protein
MEQLQHLFSFTHSFEDLDNMVVKKDNPWLRYNCQDDKNYVEMQDGDWFFNACDPVHDPDIFKIGIIIYMDKTGKWTK